MLKRSPLSRKSLTLFPFYSQLISQRSNDPTDDSKEHPRYSQCHSTTSRCCRHITTRGQSSRRRSNSYSTCRLAINPNPISRLPDRVRRPSDDCGRRTRYHRLAMNVVRLPCCCRGKRWTKSPTLPRTPRQLLARAMVLSIRPRRRELLILFRPTTRSVETIPSNHTHRASIDVIAEGSRALHCYRRVDGHCTRGRVKRCAERARGGHCVWH